MISIIKIIISAIDSLSFERDFVYPKFYPGNADKMYKKHLDKTLNYYPDFISTERLDSEFERIYINSTSENIHNVVMFLLVGIDKDIIDLLKNQYNNSYSDYAGEIEREILLCCEEEKKLYNRMVKWCIEIYKSEMTGKYKKLKSNQDEVEFIFCPDPITIDKRAEWGDNSNNIQLGSNGAFLKVSNGIVSHLVQPNEDKTAPIGWEKYEKKGSVFYKNSSVFYYKKKPIYINCDLLESGRVVEMDTRDGKIVYEVKEESFICYNCKEDGSIDLTDGWIQSKDNIIKNYIIE